MDINMTMKNELHFLGYILDRPKEFNLVTSIDQLVSRTPDFKTNPDVCPDAVGGMQIIQVLMAVTFSFLLQRLNFPPLQVLTKQNKNDHLITINVLEFLTEILHYTALIIYVLALQMAVVHQYYFLLN